MERKLVRQGNNALTVTLPAKWLQQKGLEAGNTVNIIERKNSLEIQKYLGARKKEISLDLREEKGSYLFIVISEAYVKGYDVIRIRHKGQKQLAEYTNSFIGMVVDRFDDEFLILHSVVQVPEDSIYPLIRRLGHMLEQWSAILVEIAKGQSTVADFRKVELLLDMHVLYCIRYIVKYIKEEEAYRYYLLCHVFELRSSLRMEIPSGHSISQAPVKEQCPNYALIMFSTETSTVYRQRETKQLKTRKRSGVEEG